MTKMGCLEAWDVENPAVIKFAGGKVRECQGRNVARSMSFPENCFCAT